MMWIRFIRKRKMQSIVILFMIAICSLLMNGSLSILLSLDQPYKELSEETKCPDMKVYPMFLDPAAEKNWEEELGALDSVEEAIKINWYSVVEKILMEDKEEEVFLNAVKYDERLFGNVRIIEGSMDALNEGECYIAATLALDMNLKIGSRICTFPKGGEQQYKVKAIFADPYSLNSASPTEMLVKELPKGAAVTSYYGIYLTEGSTGEDLLDEYMEKNDGILDASFYTTENVISNASISESIMGGILLALSIIIFLVCSVMIKYMIRNVLIRDRKSIAIFKSIGYTSGEILRSYVSFYLSLTICGSVLGLFVSPLISQSFMKNAFAKIGREFENKGIGMAFACILLINLVVLLQLVWELGKLKKLKPVLLLNGMEQELRIKKTVRKGMSFSSMGMALRMIGRDRKNTVMIVITCFLSIYMVNMAIATFSNMHHMGENNYYWLGFDKFDVSLDSNGDVQGFTNICSELEENPMVEKVVRNNLEIGFCIAWAQSGTGMVYETYENLTMPVVEGRNPRYSNEIVIGNLYAKEMEKEVGDYIDIFLNGSTRKSMLVVGTYQSYYNMGRGMRLLGSTLEENEIAFSYNGASVYLKDSQDAAEFMEQCRDTYGDTLKITPRKDKYSNIIEKINKPQKASLGPFTAFVVLIGGLNLVYVIYLKNISNQSKYSIYKSIGYSSGHLMKMNLYYVGVIGIASLLLTVPVFVLTLPMIMTAAMSVFGFEKYPVFYDIGLMVLGNTGVLAVFLFSALAASRDLYKNHMIELMEE